MALTSKKPKIYSFVTVVGGVVAAVVVLAGYKLLLADLHARPAKKAKPPNTLNLEELLEKDEGAFDEINSALGLEQAIKDGYTACLEGLHDRRNGEAAPNRGKDHKWSLIFTVVSRQGAGSVTDIKLPEGSSWPPHFDEEAKNCYLDLVRDQEFATSRDFTYELEWEYCVTPNTQ